MRSKFRVFCGLVLLGSAVSRPVLAEQHLNNMMMGQMMGMDPQMMMMMQMMGGGQGNGGGGETKYESKREQLQKAFEQPAKEQQKRTDEALKSLNAAADKAVSEANKSFEAHTAKDEPIDEKIASQISTPPASNSKMMKEATDELITKTQELGQAAIASAAAQAKVYIRNKPVDLNPKMSLADRMAMSGAVGTRQPASTGLGGAINTSKEEGIQNHTPGAPTVSLGATLEQRGFAPGLIHNPPKGF